MIFVPLITFLTVNWLPIAEGIKIALVFGAAFPASALCVPISSMEEKNSVIVTEEIALTTLLSMITLPVAALLLTAYYL